MNGLTAKEARNLQAAGTPQEEYFDKALARCEAAIIDVAKNTGHSSILVAVYHLNPDSLQKLDEHLAGMGFRVKSEFKDSKRSLILIDWRKDNATEERYVEEDDFREHQNREKSWETNEASGSHCTE